MAIVFPSAINTLPKKRKFAHRAEERCRMVYNIIAIWRRDGLTEDQYDNGVDAALIGGSGGQAGQLFTLPPSVKTPHPDFAIPPTEVEAAAIKDRFLLRMRRYSHWISNRAKVDKLDTTFDVDIDDDEN
jgi:hypothetical protein